MLYAGAAVRMRVDGLFDCMIAAQSESIRLLTIEFVGCKGVDDVHRQIVRDMSSRCG